MSRPSRKPPRAELLFIGTELLSGKTNTNASYMAPKLREAGFSVEREATLPDDPAPIASEIRGALRRGGVVLVCGGLGPTFDDVTRGGAARALGRTLEFRPELFARIRRKLLRHGLPVLDESRRQAELIDGATVLENQYGSAPGQCLLLRGPGGEPRTLALLPGPLRELAPILELRLLPLLIRRHRPHPPRTLAVHLSGISESDADERLSGVVGRRRGPEADFTILASDGEIHFLGRVTPAAPSRGKALAAAIEREIREAVGPYIYATGSRTLEDEVGRRLAAAGLTLAVAESCTAGMAAARLTRVPGSSRYFLGGALAYSNDMKRRLLGVRARTLRVRGAVSRECALEMARGVRALGRASIGLSITGIAGPSGGSRAKPVGLVFVGLSGPGNFSRVHEHRFSGLRETVRRRASTLALHHLLKAVVAHRR